MAGDAESALRPEVLVFEDVDLGTGGVAADGDVEVRGTVRTGARIRTPGSLRVGRAMEAADVEVGGSITVRGGIFGHKGAGRIRAGSEITAHLLHEARLEAGGDVRIEQEILHSRVHAQGRLTAERGAVIGGEIYARDGVEVRVLGCAAGVPTGVAVGLAVSTLRRVRKAERQGRELQKSAEYMRQLVQPLLANARRLSPEQRERATELLCKVDELELQIARLEQEAQHCREDGRPRGTPQVRAHAALHAGVRVGIGAREARLHRLMHGPLAIELRKVKDVTEIVAVNQRTGSVVVLPSNEVDLDAPATELLVGAAHREA